MNSRSNRDKSVSKSRGSVGKQNGGVANVSGCDSVITNKDENTVKATKSIQTETQKTVPEFKHEIAQRFESLEKQVTQLTENFSNSSAEMHKEFTKTFKQVLVGDKPIEQNV